MRRAGIACVALAVSLAVVATTAAALSPAEYRRLGNGACTKAKAQLLAAAPKSRSRAEVTRYLERALTVGRRLAAVEARLDPPAASRAPHLRAVAIVRREMRLLQAAIAKIHAGAPPIATFNNIDPQNKLSKTEEAAWRAAGLEVCAAS
jgi:hypothetical protein